MAEDVWGEGCHHRAAGATESLVMPPCAREGCAAGRTTARGWGLRLGQRCGRMAEQGLSPTTTKGGSAP